MNNRTAPQKPGIGSGDFPAALQYILMACGLAVLTYESYQASAAASLITALSIALWYWFFCLRQPGCAPLLGLSAFCAGLMIAPASRAIAEYLNDAIMQLANGSPIVYLVLRAGLVEELAKFGAAYLTLRFVCPGKSSPQSVFGAVAAAALGLAAFETFDKLHSLSDWTWKYTLYSVAMGGLVRIPTHVLLSSMWAACWVMASRIRSYHKLLMLPLGLLAAICFHGLWDLIASFANQNHLLALQLLLLYCWFWFLYARMASAIRLVERLNEL